MRFYLIDGGAAKGPFTAEQLEKLPGFDAESMVCPVGAATADDWKPAVSFEPLKAVLFKPKAPPAPVPAPPSGPSCPKCRTPNPSGAAFCFKCGARVAPEPAPAAKPPAPAPAPSPAPAPAMAPAGGALKPGPAGMGRLAAMEEPPKPLPPVVAPRPAAPPAATGLARWKTHIAAGAAVTAAFVVFFVLLKPKPKVKAPEPASAPAAEKPAEVRPSPIHTAATPAALPKPEPPPLPKLNPRRRPRPEAAPVPAPAAPDAATPAPRKRRKAARPLPAPQPAAAGAEEQVLDGLLEPSKPKPAAAAEPPAMPDAIPQARPIPGALNLPGIGQVVPKGAQPPANEPDGQTPPPAAPSRPVQTAEDLTLESAKEQFDFCHALARQRAYGDFYDTCLCPGGRRASARQTFMEDMAARPDASDSLKITGARLANPATAVITSSAGKKGKPMSQTWRLEDGLWCLDKP